MQLTHRQFLILQAALKMYSSSALWSGEYGSEQFANDFWDEENGPRPTAGEITDVAVLVGSAAIDSGVEL